VDSLEELLAEEPANLTTADVARVRGWSRVHAWRWLKSLHRKYGSDFVQRQGRSFAIGRAQLAQVLADSNGLLDPRIVRRLNDLEQRVRDVERRTDIHAKGLAKISAI
jgi:hypothetical protein